VRVNGSREAGLRAGLFQTPLADGTTGYYMHRNDDCLQAALASLLQVPPHKVPRVPVDEMLAAGRDPEEIAGIFWGTLAHWTEAQGATIMLHPNPPRTERRWIGVVGQPGIFNDHCLLMARGTLLFDPMEVPIPGQELKRADPSNIEFGITIRKE
jgi:hypothetical protein